MSEQPRRLAPSSETVRRLYLLSGNQCAFPGCTSPIIIADGTYTGELCHICAAEPKGERFDSAQSNEERRQFDNLLLMCHEHHVVTNDVSEYPVERMRELKAKHETGFSQGLARFVSSTGISILDSIVSLGGEGGKAPGAGGGGGGAIGPGARGGKGGAGGDIVQGLFSVPADVVALRVHIGKGGQAATETQASTSGEDSFVEAVRADGSSYEIARAKGGKSGDDEQGTEIKAAMFANSVQQSGGLVSALGAGWERYLVPSFPAVLEFGVLYVVANESSDSVKITTVIRDPEGQAVASATERLNTSDGSVASSTTVRVGVNAPGRWQVELSNGSTVKWHSSFEVSQRPTAPVRGA